LSESDGVGSATDADDILTDEGDEVDASVDRDGKTLVSFEREGDGIS
jgi:hypothetical protein